MPDVRVHKAVEPDNLVSTGRTRYQRLLTLLEEGSEGVIVQPKYDGVYAQLVWEGANGGRWQAYSRTGEPLPSVGKDIYDAFYTKALLHRRYIGELWMPMVPHSTINGLARKKAPQSGLQLMLFDSVEDGVRETYDERQDYLFQAGPVHAVRNIPVPDLSGDDPKEYLYALARQIKTRSSAYDGLILRDAAGLFIPGAGKTGEVIKIKPRASGDFRVVGTTRGIGNRAGGIGAIVVDLGGGVRTEVGTGLTQADVHGEDPTGRIAEVEYLAVTKDGKLREPAFKAWRFDKAVADVLYPEAVD